MKRLVAIGKVGFGKKPFTVNTSPFDRYTGEFNKSDLENEEFEFELRYDEPNLVNVNGDAE